jgi:hypothetical protein
VSFFSDSFGFSRAVIPNLPLLALSDSEQQTIKTLQAKAQLDRADMMLNDAYRNGLQVIRNLRIAVPKELEFLNTIVGWPAKAVDPYVARLSVDCFRVPTATDGDQHLMDLMAANGFAAEQSLAYDDALTLSRAYWSVGSNPDGGAPLITVESPLNMSVLWDLRGLTPRAAMQEYIDSDNSRRGALLLPNQTVHLAVNDSGEWEITGRDEHGFDFVPVVRMAHRPTTNNRNGSSAITPAIRSLTDAACRTLLGLEVARELYSVPQKVILGGAESNFQKADGSPKNAWDTYVTKVLGLERDDEGNLPQIHQMQAYDPSVFTKLLDWYASAMSGEVLSPPQSMGLYTQGNPASADSVIAMNAERDLNAVRMQNGFGVDLIRVAQTALRFENNGVLPDKYRTLATDWNPVTLSNPAVTSDAITKQIAAGSVPATSDVTLKRLGYSAVERSRLEQDRKRADGRAAAQAIAASLTPPTAPVVPGDNAGL